jgi:hydrogenase maturation protease
MSLGKDPCVGREESLSSRARIQGPHGVRGTPGGPFLVLSRPASTSPGRGHIRVDAPIHLPHLDGFERLLLIDAVKLGIALVGIALGENVRPVGSGIPTALGIRISPHPVGVQDLLAPARLTGREPPHVLLWGMEPDCLEPGTGFSLRVQEVLPRLRAEVLDELCRWGVPGRLRKGATPGPIWWEAPEVGAMNIGSEGHAGKSSAPTIQRTLPYTREEPWCMSYTGPRKMPP